MIELSKEELASYLSFYDIPKHIGEMMLPLLSARVLKRNDVLIEPGDICTTGYLIIGGGLIMSHLNPYNGEEKVVNFFLPSVQPFCTVWDSFFTGDRTSCKLFAFTTTVVCSLDKSVLESKISTDEKLRNYYLTKLNETLVFENNLRIKLITSTSEQFYQFLLAEHPQIIKKIPTKYIAEFMGISREWLSKIKGPKDG